MIKKAFPGTDIITSHLGLGAMRLPKHEDGSLNEKEAITLIREAIDKGITYVDTALEGKVDKVTGKQLSTEDYTTAEKTKLGGLPDTVNDLSAQDVTDVKAAFSLT